MKRGVTQNGACRWLTGSVSLIFGVSEHDDSGIQRPFDASQTDGRLLLRARRIDVNRETQRCTTGRLNVLVSWSVFGEYLRGSSLYRYNGHGGKSLQGAEHIALFAIEGPWTVGPVGTSTRFFVM